MVDFLKNFFETNFSTHTGNNKKKFSDYSDDINNDLKMGKQLKSKRCDLVKSLAKQNIMIEGFSDLNTLQNMNKNEFNNLIDNKDNLMRESSKMASLFRTNMSDYTKAREAVKDCKYNCDQKFSDVDIDTVNEVNVESSKKACLAGCNLSKVYLKKTPPKALGIKGEKISTCNDLEKDGPQFCDDFIQTQNCKGEGDFLKSLDLKNSEKRCNTNIPSNVSGKCFCPDGSVKAIVDCGHENFNCNEVCQPGGQMYNFKTPVNCEVSNWSNWSNCNKDCGEGTETRKRTVTQYPEYNGKSCPELTETRSCKKKDCMVEKCIPVRRIREMLCTNEKSCREIALDKGLSLGGHGYEFVGNYGTKGLYSYHSGKYKGMAFYGRGGSTNEMTTQLDGNKYRPEPKLDGWRLRDLNLWKERCGRFKTKEWWPLDGIIGCEGSTEWPNGSGRRCEWAEVPVEGFDNWTSNANPNKVTHIVSGDDLKNTCSETKKNTILNMGKAANLTNVFTKYGKQEDIVNEKAQQLQNRINDIITAKRNLWDKNDSSSQELMDELQKYQEEYRLLKQLSVGEETLKGMQEDNSLKKSSAHTQYLFWLGLAICILLIVIRQVKQ